MWPYLVLGGTGFLTAAAIAIHTIIEAFGGMPVSNIENLIGTISLNVGFGSIIVILAMIGAVYDKQRKNIITAIIILTLYIGSELFYGLFPGIESLGGIWGNIAILIAYGILRGIALQVTNKSLKIPETRYGIEAITAFGWSFLVLTVTAHISIIIGALSSYSLLIDIGLWTLILQYFANFFCLIIIAIKFIVEAIRNPVMIELIKEPASTNLPAATTEQEETK